MICIDAEYKSICYDYDNDIFYGVCKYYEDVIFKLDKNFKRLSYLKVKNKYENIKYISYDKEYKTIICTTNDIIGRVMGGSLEKVCDTKNNFPIDIISLSPDFITLISKECDKGISVYIRDKLVKKFIIPREYFTVSFTYNIDEFSNHISLYFLVRDKCGKSFILKSNIFLWEVICSPCKKSGEVKPPCNKEEESSNLREEIFKCIAKQEKAIAHILKKEADKIEKVLSNSEDIKEYLCVNKSVNEAIINITHLEQVLYNKILALDTLPCNIKDNPCKEDSFKGCEFPSECCRCEK